MTDNGFDQNGTMTNMSEINIGYSPKDFPVNKMMFWIMPIIFVIGIFGNTLVFIVMNKPKNRKLTASIYFSALAVSDSVFLIQLMVEKWAPDYLDLPLFPLKTVSTEAKILATCSFTNVGISVWLLVAVTCDRIVCVLYPIQSRIYCSIPKAKTALVLIIFVLAGTLIVSHTTLVDIEYVKFSGIEYRPRIKNGKKIAIWIAVTLIVVMPIILIATGSIVIILTLKKQVVRRRRWMTYSKNMSVTRNLLAANIGFLLCAFPRGIIALLNSYGVLNFLPIHVVRSLSSASTIILETNQIWNFYLYIISGQRFRYDVKQLLSQACRSLCLLKRQRSLHIQGQHIATISSTDFRCRRSVSRIGLHQSQGIESQNER